MKKISLILASLILLTSLTACSQNAVTTGNNNSSVENLIFPDTLSEGENESSVLSDKKASILNKVENLNLVGELYEVKYDNEDKNNKAFIDYSGGSIKISLNIKKNFQGNELPEIVSDGWYITLNGVIQNISVNNDEPCYIYTHRLVKGEDFTGERTSYGIKIEFEPFISNSDKDKKQLEISLVKISNPDFEIDSEYPVCGDLHSNMVISTRILNVNSDLKVKDVKSSDIICTAELVTKETKNKYPKLNESFYTKNGFSAVVIDENTSDLLIESNESGEIKLGAVVAGKGYEKLRLLFLVNGIPSKLSDGSDYIEIDATEGYIYTINPDRILNIKLYDTVNVLVTHCPDERKNIYLSRAGHPFVVCPNGYGK